MKISAPEEYGVRCLLQIGSRGPEASLTIPEIARAEGLSVHYAAKLMRMLRRGNLVKSVRGQAGGYTLARALSQITVAEALAVLGGRFYEAEFCEQHPGGGQACTHTVDCTIRFLWRSLQQVVDQMLSKTTLEDLLPKPGAAPIPQAPTQITLAQIH